jgi:hypothetical protein
MGAQDQRPSFYEGQYLTAEDLAAIVDYVRGAGARHALGAHTWGIAIGLELVERTGVGGRKEMVLLPGAAWDGLGRALVVPRPTRLREEDIAGVLYEESRDGGAEPKGRPLPVWLGYSESASRQPLPGFESCGPEGQHSRIAEGVEILIGPVGEGPEREAAVVVGAATMPAREALLHFDPAAAPLYDASVPHQAFPAGKRVPRWLVPIGYLRWVAYKDGGGTFAARDQALLDCSRAFRRYLGAVVENVIAADRAIVLQRRDRDPKARHKLADLLRCGSDSEELIGSRDPAKDRDKPGDLVWVEGNLRVVGDAKLAGGRLLLRDADGLDEGAPIYLRRTGDDPKIDEKKCCAELETGADAAAAAAALAKAPRELRAAIGKQGQNAHRFIVGPEAPAVAPATDGGLAPRFVVLSGAGDKETEGRAGVNTRDPNAALEVKGDWGGEDGALRLAGKEPSIRFEGGGDVGDAKWITQLTKTPAGAYRIAYRTGASSWKGVVNVLKEKVGIRTDAPAAPLGVRADGEREDLVSFEDPAGAAKWKMRLKPDGIHPGLTFTEVVPGADGHNTLFLKPGGDVGVGTLEPKGRLTINGKVQPGQGLLSFFTGTTDVEYDGGDDKLFIFTQAPAGITSFLGAKLGIGSTGPFAALAVRGSGGAEELLSFEDAAGATKWHINQKLAAAPVKGFNIAETGVADGRLFIKQGGDVGIGTFEPKQKLHVNGSFLLVQGAGNEQAYLGGDASSTDLVAQQFDDWIDELARRINNLSILEKALLVAAGFGWLVLAAELVPALKALGEDALTTIAGVFGLPPPPSAPSGGATRDVQLGSLDSAVRMVHLWNASGSPGWMSLGCQKLFEVSDERLKTHIEPLQGSLDKVLSMRGVGYRHARPEAGHAPQIGLIAQEVAKVVPEAVTTQRGVQAVSYTALVPVLVEALKELKAEVDALRAELRGADGGGAGGDTPKKKRTRG